MQCQYRSSYFIENSKSGLLRRMGHGDVTVHGFRSTFDWCAETTTHPGEVAEAALAHVAGDKVEAAYRVATYSKNAVY